MDKELALYGLGRDDVSPEDMQRLRGMEGEEMERFIRVMATNRLMEQHGLQPLVADDQGTAEKRPAWKERPKETQEESMTLSPAEEEAMHAVGLTREQYAVLRGSSGQILGLQFSASMYHRLLAKCKSKQAKRLANDREACKRFIMPKIRDLAIRQLGKSQKTQQMGLDFEFIQKLQK